MRFVLTPVFGVLVKFVMAPKLSLWVRSVPPAVLLLLADDGRDPSGMWPHPLSVRPDLPCRDDDGCASPGMRPCPLWARPDLVCRDAFDADGLRGPVRERPCFGP